MPANQLANVMIAAGAMAATPMWSDVKAESVRNLCDVLIDAGSLMGQKVD